MALGYTTYKTPNAIFTIGEDLTGKEGCGVYLYDQGYVKVATATADVPYGIVTVGGPSEDGVTYPGLIGGSSVEFVDMLGCTVQVQVSTTGGIAAGEFVLIDNVEQDGTFVSQSNVTLAVGDWLWGLALTNALAGEQCLIRFQPFVVQYVAPPPP
jgi:hypothetical protein